MSLDEALKLAIKGLKIVLEKEYSVDRVDAAFISESTKKFTQIPREQIEKLSK